MWLRDEGLERGVRKSSSQAAGRFEKELTNLYVANCMAKAILAPRPEFAAKPSDVRIVLQKQFPPTPRTFRSTT